MEREIEHNDVPAELLHGIREHRRGLHHVTLHQMQGRSSYVQVRGARWRLDSELGEPPGPDDEPASETEEIARTLYAEAEVARNEGGHPHFKAVLYCTTKDSATKHDVKFSVGEMTRIEDREERAHGTTVDRMAQYIGDLQAANIRQTRVNAMALEYVSRALPQLMALRMDAIDERAEALLEGLGARPKRRPNEPPEENPWKPAADSIQQVIKTFGPAVAVKSFNLTPEQAKALFTDDKPSEAKVIDVKELAANAGVRDLLKAFGESLSDKQKGLLLAALDPALVLELQGAAKADSEVEAAKACAHVLDVIEANKAKSEALEALLTKPQADLLKRAINTVASTLEAAGIEPKD